MTRRFCISIILVVSCLCSLAACAADDIQSTGSSTATPGAPGDRVVSIARNLDQWIPAMLPRESYRIAPGDTLAIHVQGRATLTYRVRPDAGPSEDPNEVTVSPSGDIFIPLAGKITAAGRTVSEFQEDVEKALSKYIKNFSVMVSVSKVRTLNIWISGEVENPGPQILPAVSTVSLAVLQAGIKPTGSTRRITLTRNGKQQTVDLYKMAITGVVDGDISLEPGDQVHVPPVTDYVEVRGEVTRPGRYEMVGLEAGSDGFSVQDLLRLSLGATPAAARDRAVIERIGSDSRRTSLSADLRNQSASSRAMQAGDVLLVPSIEAFQPMIHLIGEFKGDGVYQRTPGASETDVENRSGIYFLKSGQTVLDVIAATGGVTPQADLKRAYIERKGDGKTAIIPVDLDRLMVRNDKTADVVLHNGDSLILPATADKVHVFGEVKSPGSYVYSPMRSLVDYLGDAGGPTERSKLSDVTVVRGSKESPLIMKFNAEHAIRGNSAKDNPKLEPGDIVFVPQKFISNWRDGVQLLFSALSLGNLLSR